MPSNRSSQVLFQSEHHPLVAERFDSLEQYCLSLIHLKAYETAAELARGKVVLDLGCNNGYGTDIISRAAARVTGVDVSPRSIEAARARCPNIEFQQVDGVTLPFADASFDAVFSFQVIEHIDDPTPYLKEIRRVLRPGGLFMLTTPNRELRLEPGMKPWNEFHVREYSSGELATFLASQFPNVEVHGLMGTPELRTVEERRVRRARLVVQASRKSPLANSVLGPLRRVRRRILDAMSSIEVVRHRRERAFRRFRTSDLSYDRNGTESALDLMALCRT